jgi:hypothetical protein
VCLCARGAYCYMLEEGKIWARSMRITNIQEEPTAQRARGTSESCCNEALLELAQSEQTGVPWGCKGGAATASNLATYLPSDSDQYLPPSCSTTFFPFSGLAR